MAVCKNKHCRTILRSGNKIGYCSVCEPPEKHKGGALEKIGRDILPKCIDAAALPLRQETHEDYKPYVRFTRTVARPAGRQ